MPRHSNKPALSSKNTKALLQSIQETREATQEIKAELLEHNSVIKLHADEDTHSGSGRQDEKHSFTSSNVKQPNPLPPSGEAESNSKTASTTEGKSSPKVAVSAIEPQYSSPKSKDGEKELYKKDQLNFNSESSKRHVETESRPTSSTKPAQNANTGSGKQKGGVSDTASSSLQKNIEQWMEIQSTFSRMFFDNWTSAFRRSKEEEKK